MELTSLFGCFCVEMLAADWSWSGNVLYFMSIASQRGEGKQNREKRESLLSTEFSKGCPEFNPADTQSHPQRSLTLAHS